MPIDWDLIDQCLQGAVVGGVAGGAIGLPFFLLSVGTCVCSKVILGAILGSTIAFIISKLKVDHNGKAVLITGCDSGFGHALALHLNKLGFTVFAGCLNVRGAGAAELKQAGSSSLHVIALDVCSMSQLSQAVKYVKQNLPRNGLWAIVNNAGVSNFGEVECLPMESYTQAMEVNALGVVRVCKTFLPLIRRTKGRVVNISSGIARLTCPSRSGYIMSKSAVEGFTAVLRYEMRQWGVKVIVLEPGNYIAGTNIFTKEAIRQQADLMWSKLSDELKSSYGKSRIDATANSLRQYVTAGVKDISLVIDAFTNAITDKYPRQRYQPMNLYYKLRYYIGTFLPTIMYDKLYVQ